MSCFSGGSEAGQTQQRRMVMVTVGEETGGGIVGEEGGFRRGK